jgi:hypothetical protein
VRIISLMFGDILTRKAWDLSFKEWKKEGEGVFADFMKRNQGPDSNYGGGKINYSASQIMGVRNDNQPSEAWFRILKGSEASQTPPVVNLTVNFHNFLNEELGKAFKYDTLHVAKLTSLRTAHGSMICRDRSVPTLVLAACALFDSRVDMAVRTNDELKQLCEFYDRTGDGLIYLVNGLPRLGKSIQDEDIREWLRVVFDPNPQEDDYVMYYHQIVIGLSLVTSTLDPGPSLPIVVQHCNLPFTCTCREFWDSSLCHCSLSVADQMNELTPFCLTDMFHLIYSHNPGHITLPGPRKRIHTRQRYSRFPTRFHQTFGLPHNFLDNRFLFLAHLTHNQMLDLARARKSNFHGQTQNTLNGNSLMEMILEGTGLADVLLLQSGKGSLPSFFKRHRDRKASQWPPLPPIPGFGPNARLLFRNHIYPPGVDILLPYCNGTYLVDVHTDLFQDIPHQGQYLPICLLCELLRSPLTAIVESHMRESLLSQKGNLTIYKCGGDRLVRSIIRLLGKDHPCIPSLKVELVSIQFTVGTSFHVYTDFVNQLHNCVESILATSRSCTILLSTHGKRFVIHRVVRPPMQTEYHLIDLHPVSNSEGSRGVRVVCFDVNSLARLVHRIWWHYLPDGREDNREHSLVRLQLASTDYQELPCVSSIATLLNGLGLAVSLPLDLVHPTPGGDADDSDDSDDDSANSDTSQSSDTDSSPLDDVNDSVFNFLEKVTGDEQSNKSSDADDVNEPEDVLSVLIEMHVENGSSFDSSIELKKAAHGSKRKKNKQSSGVTRCVNPTSPDLSDESSIHCVDSLPVAESDLSDDSSIRCVDAPPIVKSSNNPMTRVEVTVEALQAMQDHLNDVELMDRRYRNGLPRKVQVRRPNGREGSTQGFFRSLKETSDLYSVFLKKCMLPCPRFEYRGEKQSTLSLFSSNNGTALSSLFQLAESVSFKSLPFAINRCTMSQIQQHLTRALKSIDSMVPWTKGLNDYLDACGDDRDSGVLVYSLLQWMRNHLFLLNEFVSGQIQVIGKNSLPSSDILIILGSTTPIDEAMNSPHSFLHALDLRIRIYEDNVGTLIDSLTTQHLFQLFGVMASLDPVLAMVYGGASMDEDDGSKDSRDSEGGDLRCNYQFCKPGKPVIDSLPVKILLAGVASVGIPNVYGVNLYNSPHVSVTQEWDLLRVRDAFPPIIADFFSLDQDHSYQPIRKWVCYNTVTHDSFSHRRNRISKNIELLPSDGEQESIADLLSTNWSTTLYSFYTQRILAPCKMCSGEEGRKNYLACTYCSNRPLLQLCGAAFATVFASTPKKLGVSDLRRLRNPLEAVHGVHASDDSFYLNDEIVNTYIDLLSLKYPRHQDSRKNFYFSSFFTEKLMNL